MSDIYGPGSAAAPAPVAVIDGVCGRKLNNALTMKFLDNGAGEPFATALQSGADGVGKKLGILFGFKNGATGAHVVTYAHGTTLSVPMADGQPTKVVRGDGTAVCTITRGATSAITSPDGAPLLTFLPDPVDPEPSSHFRLQLRDGAGVHLATLDVIRDAKAYGQIGVGEVLEAVDFVMGGFVSDPGGSLPLPFLGTRVSLYRELTALERDALLAACVEIGIGVRPYVAAMGEQGAAWT